MCGLLGTFFDNRLLTKFLVFHSVFSFSLGNPGDPPNFLHALHSGCLQLSRLLQGSLAWVSSRRKDDCSSSCHSAILATRTNKILRGASGDHVSNRAAAGSRGTPMDVFSHQRDGIKNIQHPNSQGVGQNYLCFRS